MDGKGFQFRQHPACTFWAVVVAGLYWATVFGAYFAAESAHDALGYADIPFILLSEPWFSLLYGVVSQIPNHDVSAFYVGCLLPASLWEQRRNPVCSRPLCLL